jgi:NADH dehydrogenase [ubiquinone] 1 alpha subcomplex assembly factor 1
MHYNFIFFLLWSSIVMSAHYAQAEKYQSLLTFDSPDSLNQWQIINDGVMGGISSSDLRLTGNNELEFFGNLSLDYNGGFASTRRPLDQSLCKAINGFALRVLGDGRTYQFRVRTRNSLDGIAYRQNFETRAGEWITIQLPIERFIATFRGRQISNAAALKAENVRQVGILLGDGQEGSFVLKIASIETYALAK